MKELKLNLQGSWKRVLAMLTVAAMCFTVVGISPTFAAEGDENAKDVNKGVSFVTSDEGSSKVEIESQKTVTMDETDSKTFTAIATIVSPDEVTASECEVTWDSNNDAVKMAENVASVVTQLEADETATITVSVSAAELDEPLTDTVELTVEKAVVETPDDPADVSAAEAVEKVINNLPAANDITLENKADVEAARAAYDELNDAAKALVSEDAVATLEAAEAKIAALEAEETPNPADVSAAEAVEKLINDLPATDDIKLENKADVEAARAAYGELNDAAKALVSEDTVAKLEAAEAKIADLEAAETPDPADVSAAEAVEKLISDLPAADDITLENKADVEAARAAYGELNDAAKALVSEDAVAKLEAAEKQIADLEKAENDAAAAKKAADDAAKLISDLPAADKLTLADKAKVDAAKKAYDALSADAKALVSKDAKAKLDAAVAKIADLEKADANKKDDTAKNTDPTKGTTVAPKVGEKKVVAGVTYQVAKNNTVTYQKPKKNAKKVTIPATVKINGKTYKVTAVAKNAFKGNKKVKTVKVGKNVTSIGASAFQNCKALTTVTLPAKTKTIGKNAFANSKKLKKIVIKSTKMTKKTIKNGAFKKVSKKVTVDVPNKKAKTYKKLFQKKGLPKACKVK